MLTSPPPYALVRIGRGFAGAAAVTLVTGDSGAALGAIALTESVSAAVDLVGILPYFGNMFWLVMLWPSFTSMYHQTYLFNMRERHRAEFKSIVPVLLVLLGVNIWLIQS